MLFKLFYKIKIKIKIKKYRFNYMASPVCHEKTHFLLNGETGLLSFKKK